jgi:hypothetical protein
MEEDKDFLSELEVVLAQQSDALEKKELLDLKDTIRLYTSTFEGIYNLFLKKGLIAEDPYKYDQKISDITPPSTDFVLDSDKVNAISQRLSVYDSQLDFLNNYYQFSSEFITMPRIKRIIVLIKWIKWNNFTEAAAEINTKILAELFGKVTQGTDQMSIKLLNDSSKRMRDLSQKIVTILKTISNYQREKYKFDIRSNIIIQLDIEPNEMLSNPEGTLLKIKQNFVKLMGKGQPFYAELIKEIFMEETSSSGETLKKELIKKLKIKQSNKEEKKEINYRKLLNESLRILSTVATPLEQVIKNLDFNNSLIKEKTLSFGDKFRLWIMNLSGKESTNMIIDIDIFDERLSTTKTTQLDFNKYLENGRKKMRQMAALSNKVSTTYRKLETASEDTVLNFISKSLEDITIISSKLDPINTYLKSEAGREQRKALKDVKIEFTSIKNILVKTNQKRHEYLSRMEEIEQMKKLGVM